MGERQTIQVLKRPPSSQSSPLQPYHHSPQSPTRHAKRAGCVSVAAIPARVRTGKRGGQAGTTGGVLDTLGRGRLAEPLSLPAHPSDVCSFFATLWPPENCKKYLPKILVRLRWCLSPEGWQSWSDWVGWSAGGAGRVIGEGECLQYFSHCGLAGLTAFGD